MQQIQVIAHSGVCVAHPEGHLQLPDGAHSESAHRLELLPELFLHLIVNGILVQAHHFPAAGLDLAAFAEAEHRVSHISGSRAAVDKRTAWAVLTGRTVVVRGHQDVGPAKGLEDVKSLAFIGFTVSVSSAGMDNDHDRVGLEGTAQLKDTVLHQRYQRHVFGSGPQLGREPARNVGVVESQHEYLAAALFQQHVVGEERLAVGTDGVACEPGYAETFQLLPHAVIDRVSGFHVVVAHRTGVVAHICCNARPDVRLVGRHIVEVVRCIVALKHVAGIQQHHILLAHGSAQAVHVMLDGHKAGLGLAALDIRTGEIGAVHVSCSHDVQFIPRVLRKYRSADDQQR